MEPVMELRAKGKGKGHWGLGGKAWNKGKGQRARGLAGQWRGEHRTEPKDPL